MLSYTFSRTTHHIANGVQNGVPNPALYIFELSVRQEMIERLEIRRVQAYSGERSLTFVLPKIFSEKLGIEKGDYLKVYLEENKLIIQKAEV